MVRKPDSKAKLETSLPTVDEYNRPGFVPQPADRIITLLPAGSRLKIARTEYYTSILDSYMRIWAESADGRFQGEVYLNELFDPEELLVSQVFQQPKPYHVTLQPDWLEVVPRDNSAR